MAGQRVVSLIAAAVGIASIALCRTGAAAIPLQLKLDKGKTYYQRTVLDQRITQAVMGQQQVVNISIGTGLKLDVLDVDAQGNMRIRHTFTWCMSQQAGPMANIRYDSAKQSTPPAGAEAFAAILGQSYFVTLSPKGEVLDVNGVEEMREAVRKRLPAGADTSPSMSALASYLDKRGIKEMAESLLSVYPKKPVEVGESWSEKRVVSLGFGLITESTCTLQKREAGVATIGIVASVRSNPEMPPIDAGGMKMKFEVAGTQEGTVRVAEATGLILSDQSTQQLKGEIKASSAAAAAPMMAIPVTFETSGKVEMSDKPWEPDAQ
jgi:hypothetical protein